jgi:Tol biopolymer transport system component
MFFARVLDRGSLREHIVVMKNIHFIRWRQILVAFLVLCTGSSCGAPPPPPRSDSDLNILFQLRIREQYDILCLKTEGVYPDSLCILPEESVAPVWSPDRSRFVFSHERDRHFALAIADADGGNLQYLTSDTADNFNIASWFPSGDSIVFSTNRNGNKDLYTIRTDGSGLAPLLADSADEWHPVITPDGRRMVYVSDATGRPRIWALDFASQKRLLVFKPDSLTAEFEPAISPDGLYLAYSRVVRRDNARNFDIVVYDLVKNTADLIITDPAMDRYPRFSQDGKKILFHSDRTGVNALYIYDRDSRTTRPLNVGTLNSAYGDW